MMTHFTDEFGRRLTLTSEQQNITQITTGRHAVIGVAGCSKTTTLAARVHALINSGADPKRILVTTFGSEATELLKTRIHLHPKGRQVTISTIHRLGNSICTIARQNGQSALQWKGNDDPTRILYMRALQQMREDGTPSDVLKQINEEDFNTYIEIQKANLRYHNLEHLNETQRLHASEISRDGNTAYRDIYRIYEQLRLKDARLTFSDMITHAWELLTSHDSLRNRIESRYDHVITDEYQDVNLAMERLLSIISTHAKSIMVCGDDDQTIYSWRGSSPRFLQEFIETPGTEIHHLSLNFRSQGPITAVAGEVIQKGVNRVSKYPKVTQGMGGNVTLHDSGSQTEAFIHEMRSALTRFQPRDIAVLIRRYGQTAPLEQALLEAEIPYKVLGSAPFFQRAEIKPILHHLRLAGFDYRRNQGHQASTEELQEMKTSMMGAYSRPTRFMSRVQAEEVVQMVIGGMSVSNAILTVTSHGRRNPLIEQFALDLNYLSKHFDHEGEQQGSSHVIERFVHSSGYLKALKEEAALPELAQEKEDAVLAFQQLAGQRSLADFLDHIDTLNQKHLKSDLVDPENILLITTIFRAKGQQYPCVFLPDVDSDTYATKDRDTGDSEEERRVFYVGLSRAQKEMHLLYEPHQDMQGRTVSISPFLEEINIVNVLHDMRRLKTCLAAPPSTWKAKEAYHFALSVQKYHFSTYFQEFWNGDGASISGVLHALQEALNEKGLTHELTNEVLATWAYFGDTASQCPNDLDDLIAELSGIIQVNHLTSGLRIVHPKHGQGYIQQERETAKGRELHVQYDNGTFQRVLAHNASFTTIPVDPATDLRLN